ncbi:ABC transporter ATP-binding protein [Clostridium sp. CM028]|uniref:ABC transporter ATP-binding protein n=1 Tax=Clostridium sp. CM028 TaxID=2851575 RepID=UPI001C6EDEC5|nr:ABC transporter ATP-binding protein [Clostridium sp. CM028]MBW9147927.1 ABC transporter ATP-binding protein [Clostridium sp. CM028]WLC61360.1 ABC transporter ATP-binding protein [Clostridium sp. CM028]
MNEIPYVSIENISKTFGKVIANKNMNLTVHGGEIHALLGENGAGKSTLMNMLSGVYTPDSGSIFIHGKNMNFTSPKDAIKAGIGMIYQHFKLVEEMTAKQNILLGQNRGLFFNDKLEIKKINDICVKFHLEMDVNKYVCDMAVGERQNLEILKVLYRGADVLVLDEPTTVFTQGETEKLFKIMRKMKEQGCAIIFISHKMDEVMEICDKITVLRKGEAIKTVEKENTTPKQLTELMMGRKADLSINKVNKGPGDIMLKVKDLKVLNAEKAEIIKNISFSLRSSEILGVAGIAGSGQRELCEAIAGIEKVASGEIVLEGENLVGKSPRDIINKGISMSFIPEDRLGMGLVASMGMVDNLLLKDYHTQKGIFIDRKPVVIKAKKMVEKFEIKTPDIHHPIKYLSGGNIQKILVGRELSMYPKILVMAYAVRGLDINTCYTIYDLISQEKEKGTAVLFIGEDLDVLIKLCDRIMVLCDGEVTGIVDAKKASREEIGMMMVGNTAQMEEN